MGFVFKVKAKSTLPVAGLEWTVDLLDDPEMALIYTNLGYDLIAASMAKLGVEFSKYLLDPDRDRALERFNEEMNKAMTALRNEDVA